MSHLRLYNLLFYKLCRKTCEQYTNEMESRSRNDIHLFSRCLMDDIISFASLCAIHVQVVCWGYNGHALTCVFSNNTLQWSEQKDLCVQISTSHKMHFYEFLHIFISQQKLFCSSCRVRRFSNGFWRFLLKNMIPFSRVPNIFGPWRQVRVQ